MSFVYSIYNHNWRNISTIYVYITRLTSNEIISPSNKIHREVGRAKDLSAPLYYCSNYMDFERTYVRRITIYVSHRQPVDTDVCQEVLASNPERRVALLKDICL